MTEPTRRQTIKMIGASTAVVALPAMASAAASVPVRAAVQGYVDSLAPETIKAALDGTYAKVFKHYPTTMAVESVVHTRVLGLGANLEKRRLYETDEPEPSYQRFVYNATPVRRSDTIAIVDDDDRRAGIWGSAREPSLASRVKAIDPSALIPSRLSDLPETVARLIGTFRDAREVEAANVLNTAHTYNASIGGDGVCLCSLNHPHDHGMWANTFATPGDLNAITLEEAGKGISEFVDDVGQRINVRPTQLVVGRGQADAAKRLTAASLVHNYTLLPHLVWEHLNPDAWFVQTDVSHGLMWYERQPFQLDVWHDNATDMRLLKGYERRCFTYTNPRAVFGVVFPT